MALEKSPLSQTVYSRTTRDQLVTVDDLQQFKQQLVDELSTLLEAGMQPAKRWLKTNEVKKLLNVSPGTLQTLRVNGTLQYSKIGGIIYYDHDHIQKTLLENLGAAG